MARSFYIKESELDNYQVKVINRKTESSFIVRGCAGSGKSILALWKVKQIQEQELGSYYFIVFTKSLRQYMKDGIDTIGLNNNCVVYFEQWKKMGCPSADYIIVDEAQDFTEENILLFKSKANTALMLYGDSNQQIFSFKKPVPISMEEIIHITKFKDEKLVFNHRLPKKIARVAELIGEDVEDLSFVCTEEGTELPKILSFNNNDEQYDEIVKIIKARQFEDVGILLPNNAAVKEAYNKLKSKLDVECAYWIDFGDNIDNLDFTTNKPKITTYYRSKGLQFEAVFIPRCDVEDEDKRSPLYVALTRSYQSLFILHNNNLSSFFDEVSPDLYETSLISQASRRL